MTLTIPPLSPSAESRLHAVNFLARDDFMRASAELMLAYNEGTRATLAAVVAWLREPEKIETGVQTQSKRYVFYPPRLDECAAICRAIADLLERESHG